MPRIYDDIIMSRRVQLRRERLSLHRTWFMTFNLMVAKGDLYVSPRTINRPILIDLELLRTSLLLLLKLDP